MKRAGCGYHLPFSSPPPQALHSPYSDGNSSFPSFLFQHYSSRKSNQTNHWQYKLTCIACKLTPTASVHHLVTPSPPRSGWVLSWSHHTHEDSEAQHTSASAQGGEERLGHAEEQLMPLAPAALLPPRLPHCTCPACPNLKGLLSLGHLASPDHIPWGSATLS